MGMRCMRMVYGFRWDAGQNQYMVRPDGDTIKLVIGDLPYANRELSQLIPDEKRSIFRTVPAAMCGTSTKSSR